MDIQDYENAIKNNHENIDLYNLVIDTKQSRRDCKKSLQHERRALQNNINNMCALALQEAKKELNTATKSKRLRTCTALVYETKNYYILQSYNTIIACINKNTDTLYDCLRIVYGYTSTSTQHTRKFSQDYGKSFYGCHYTWQAR